MANDNINPITAWCVAIVGWVLGRLKYRWEKKNCGKEVDKVALRRDKKAIMKAKLKALKLEAEAYRRLHDPRFKDGIERHIDTT